MSAAFLLATLQGGGNVTPELGLARRLVLRGHRVHVLSEPTVEAEARAAGCGFTAWPTAPAGNAIDRDAAAAKDWELRTPAQVVRFLRGLGDFLFGAADRFAADVLDVQARERADAMLVDFALVGANAGAERLGLPTAALMPSIYMRPTPGRPVLGSGWGPARGVASRIRDVVVPYASDRLIDLGLPRVNAARSQLGLDSLPHVLAALDRCARVLVLTSPTFDPPPARLPPNVRYVGPMLDDPSWAGAWSPPWSAHDQRPLVLVAMSSTYQAQHELLARVVQALAGLPVRGLVTLGPGLRAGEVTGAANVTVVPSAPHAEVLPHAAAVVTHAGHGSAIKALAAGVPLICLPHGRDQADNAVRVLALGAGLRLSRRAGAVPIRAAVRRVLEDPSFARNASAAAAALSAEAARGPNPVDEAEQLVGRRG